LNLIEASLGDPTGFPFARENSRFIEIAQSAGVRCPETVILRDDNALHGELAAVPFPAIVKADRSHGGLGVRLVKNIDDARAAIGALATLFGRRSTMGYLIGERAASTIFGSLSRRRRTVCLQRYIVGRPANRAVLCYKGQVLAGISVEALDTEYEFGPASIVRVIDHLEMALAAETLVRRLGLSGFIGFDFALDPESRAWLLEMNARVTPTCHICAADGTNLPAALLQFFRIGESGVQSARGSIEKPIVLFPHGVMHRRSCSSLIYDSSEHDVPWDEPELVYASIRYVLRKRRLKRLREELLRVYNRLLMRS
jgi:glutathione synthase/RimK-type ligase-like ATP-grasp enzyme